MRIEEYTGSGSLDKVEVGMKCTIHFYSDADPCEVVKVSKSGKTCYIRRNEVCHDPSKEGGMGHQNWLIHENEFEGDVMKITKRKNGQWRETGSNCFVALGQWKKYYDWEF